MPRCVLDISPVDNRVTVGPAEALDVVALTGIRPRWCGPAPEGPGEYSAQLRAHGGEVPVTAEAVDGELRVSPALAASPRARPWCSTGAHPGGGVGDHRHHRAARDDCLTAVACGNPARWRAYDLPS
jgi:hypothetical protein